MALFLSAPQQSHVYFSTSSKVHGYLNKEEFVWEPELVIVRSPPQVIRTPLKIIVRLLTLVKNLEKEELLVALAYHLSACIIPCFQWTHLRYCAFDFRYNGVVPRSTGSGHETRSLTIP